MNKKKKRSRDEYGPNPFLSGLEIKVAVLTMNEDGQRVVKRLDKAGCVKMFLGMGERQVREELSLRGKELLLYIMDNAGYGQDVMKINRKRVMERLGMKSLKTITNAVIELCRAGIIGRSKVRGVYFLNPAHFFRGSRITSFPDNIVESKKENDNGKQE